MSARKQFEDEDRLQLQLDLDDEEEEQKQYHDLLKHEADRMSARGYQPKVGLVPIHFLLTKMICDIYISFPK